MSDANNLTFNSFSAPWMKVEVKERKGKGGKVTPASFYYSPNVTTDAKNGSLLADFFTAFVTKAREVNKDLEDFENKLLLHVFGKTFKDATKELVDADGNVDDSEWLEEICQLGRVTIDLEAQFDEASKELIDLNQFLALPGDDADALAKQAAMEAAGISIEEFTRRFTAATLKYNKLRADLAKHEQEKEVRAKERKAKKAAEKAAEKAAAPAAA